MSVASLKKLLSENGVVAIIALVVGLYALSILSKYFSSKSSSYASEGAAQMEDQHKNSLSSGPMPPQMTGIQPADEKPNEYSLVNESQTMSQAPPQMEHSSELLPADKNNQWAQLNPSGGGDLHGINLLKAGYHIGIDTIGQTLRNANLQIRSEPPNPQISVGPWNQTTIAPDLMRIPLELGSGSQ